MPQLNTVLWQFCELEKGSHPEVASNRERISFAAANKRLASSYEDEEPNKTKLLDPETRKCLCVLKHPSLLTLHNSRVQMSPDENLIVTTAKNVCLWDAKSGNCLAVLPTTVSYPTTVTISRDSNNIWVKTRENSDIYSIKPLQDALSFKQLLFINKLYALSQSNPYGFSLAEVQMQTFVSLPEKIREKLIDSCKLRGFSENQPIPTSYCVIL